MQDLIRHLNLGVLYLRQTRQHLVRQAPALILAPRVHRRMLVQDLIRHLNLTLLHLRQTQQRLAQALLQTLVHHKQVLQMMLRLQSTRRLSKARRVQARQVRRALAYQARILRLQLRRDLFKTLTLPALIQPILIRQESAPRCLVLAQSLVVQ